MRLLLVHSFLPAIGIAHASDVLYGPHVQQPYGIVTATSAPYTSAASYDDVISTPPTLLNPPPPTSFDVQLQTDSDNEFTGYAIYENGHPTRVALINFVDDNSGTSDHTASISVGGAVPSQVRVKHLSASSVTQMHNITWSCQTFGDVFDSDGRPVGVVDVQTVDCDQTNNVCNVKVPAPGAALVFLSDQAPTESDQGPTMIPPMTACTELHITATADPAAADALEGTSQGECISGAIGPAHALPSFGALVAVCAFVCIESLLSYAVTGRSLLGFVSDMTKNAR